MVASKNDLNGDNTFDQTLMEIDENEALYHLPHKKVIILLIGVHNNIISVHVCTILTAKIDSATVRRKIHVSLKCIESLTFDITDAKKLQELLQQAELLERSCRDQLHKKVG